MHSKPGEINPPDTILSSQNFLLLHEDVTTAIRQALSRTPIPPDLGLTSQDGLLWQGNRLFVPDGQRLAVLQLCHDNRLAGHFGTLKTLDLLLRTFWWPSVEKDCKDYVSSCTTCAQHKDCRSKAWGLLNPLPVPERAWSMITMDFIVELPPSQGYNTIFVIVDRLTKMAHFVPMKGTPTAAQTAEVFIREVVRLHGLPKSITSDRGVQFTSRFWRALCAALEIQVALSSAYHPQTNGQTERTNQTLEQYLRCFSSFTQDNWSSLLPLAEYAYNNATHSATKQSPFLANYGFHPTTFPNASLDNTVPAAHKSLEELQENIKTLRETLLRSQQTTKERFDRKRRGNLVLKPGDKVWLATKNIRLACPAKKLGPRFIGPFRVKRCVNPVAFELELPASLRIHPVFHVSLLKPVVPNPFPARQVGPPDPILVQGSEEFEVEAILNCRKRGSRTEFLIKWKGYGPEENSWEPAGHIHAPALLKNFLRRRQARQARLGIRRLPLRGGQCQGTRRPSRGTRAEDRINSR